MPEVLDQLSKVIGRKVEPLAAPKAPAKTETPAAADKGGTPSLESVIGRKPQAINLPEVPGARFGMYSRARQNGLTAEAARNAAMSTGVLKEWQPTTWDKFKTTIGDIPVGPSLNPNRSKTVRDLGEELGRVGQRVVKNPLLMSDEQWAKQQQEHKEFFERHLGKTWYSGAAQGTLEFGEEFLNPFQVALAVGTFGESALARVGAKAFGSAGVTGARTLSKLMQAQFIAQMTEGTVAGANQTIDAAVNGDWEAAGKIGVETLASGLMAKGLISHEEAVGRVRGDLDKTAREMFGVPDNANPVMRAVTNRFDQLDPYRQGAVIEKAVQSSPEYKETLSKIEGQSQEALERTKKQQGRRLQAYYGTALDQAWNPNVALRTIRGLQRGRIAGERIEAKREVERKEDQRQQSIRDVVRTIREGAERRSREIEAQEEQRRAEGREERPERRKEFAEQRSQLTETAKNIDKARKNIYAERSKAQETPPAGALPKRDVESFEQDGQVFYPADFWGEQHAFGVVPNVEGHAVFRQTPRGVEWMSPDGEFVDTPDDIYFSHDPATADTVARLTALTASADSAAEAEGASEEQRQDADTLAGIRRDLVSGTIDARKAQQLAGIAEKVKLGDEFDAARDGKLNGPYHDSSPREFLDNLEQSMRREQAASGWMDEDIQAVLDEAPLLARQHTENNLNHVYRPGDYIVSKRGVTWTLDRRGMLHPDNGGAPVPLMRDGLYSNQAMQLAGSGRIGYGTRTRAERMADRVKRRDVAAAIQEQQEQTSREMVLAVQREGLEAAPENAPREDEGGKAGRRGKWLEKPPAAPGTEAIRQIGKLVYKAPADPNSVIQSIARRTRVSPEEVMRQALANDPARANTTEAKIARLEVGDRITDDFRKDRPWMVEERNGQLFLRSGQANPLPLDRLNPSDRVRQIVERGVVTSDAAEFNEDDVRRAAFEAPHVIRQRQAVEDINDRKEGKVKDPEPRNEKQAAVQAKAAGRRAEDAQSAATVATIDALNPDPAKLDEADANVQKANAAVEAAEEGYAQAVEAKAKTVPKDEFPQRAPASIGYTGQGGTIVQNQREHPFHYELLPLDAVQTSHAWVNGKMEANPDYPEVLQPRTVSEEESGENKLRAEIGNYDFRQYADRTINGAMGPAIVDKGGRGVGGNTRLAIMRRHVENMEAISDPEEREARLLGFQAAMRRLAQDVGIGGYPNDGKQYVVVRMLDKPIETTREANELGLLFNKQIGVQITQAAKGVAYAKALDERTLETIGRMVELHDGVIAAMEKDPQFFEGIVRDKFGISPNEDADWFRTVDGTRYLNEQGRSQFVKAMLGTVIKDTSILNRIEGTEPYRALERGLSYVLKMRALPDRDITGKIVEAIQAAADTKGADPQMHPSRDLWKATYVPTQTELAGMETEQPPEPDRMVEVLWRALHASNAAVPRVFNDRLKSFVGEETSEAGWLTGATTQVVETPAEAFSRAFEKEMRQVALSRGDKNERFTDEEFKNYLDNQDLKDETPTIAPRGELIPPADSKNLAPMSVQDAITAFRSGKSVFAATTYGDPSAGIFPLESEAEIREFGGALYESKAHKPPESEASRLLPPPTTKGSIVPKPFKTPDGKWHVIDERNGKFIKTAVDEEDAKAQAAQMEAVNKKYHDAWLAGTKEGIVPKKGGLEPPPKVGEQATESLTTVQKALVDSGIPEAQVRAMPHTEQARRYMDLAKSDKTLTSGRVEPPPTTSKNPATLADLKLEADKQKGYVSPEELKQFLETHPSTKAAAPELYRTAQMMAEYVFDADPPVGVDRKDALGWILRERLARIEAGDSKTKRGEYSDPAIEKGLGTKIMRLHEASDPSTFIHEFSHVVFPMLSDEDLKLIDSIGGEKVWDGQSGSLKGTVYRSLSEKFAHGLERFLRDENPTGFNSEVKAILGKIKDIMRRIYLAFRKDPLSGFEVTEDAKQVFAEMFHVTDFDAPDKWRKEVERARAKEKAPAVELDEAARIAKDMGALGSARSIDGKVEDTIGDRVDPTKPTMTAVFNTQEEATAAAVKAIRDGKANGVDVIAGTQGKWGVKFNVEKDVLNQAKRNGDDASMLFQELPERHPGVHLQDLEARLKTTPTFKLMERKLLQMQIDGLKNRIRADHGIEERKPPQTDAAAAKKVLQEAKSEAKTERVGGGIDAPPRIQNAGRTGPIPRPPKLGMPDNAGAGQRSGSSRGPASRETLGAVAPVRLEPLPRERGNPVGTVKGESFDQAKWTESLKKAGLPENLPAPTVALDRKTAEKLIFPGQKQIVQTALSALEHGDGFAIVVPPGAGKTFHAAAIIKETQRDNPNARILYISMNRKLLKKTQRVSDNSFGFKMELEAPADPAQTGVWGVSYAGMLNDLTYKQMRWDLVVADESGAARRAHDEKTQWGPMLRDVVSNSKKAVYMSATPFHSPMEYGYMDKLGLWQKGQFDRWIQENFAHEKIGDKIVARLDPPKQAKLREQLIERGQLVSQQISYEGYTAHFGVVPVTEQMKRGLNRIREGFDRARAEFMKRGKKGLAQRVSAFESVYTKNFLERERLPQAIELAKKARKQGWRVLIFSEHTADDLFRRERMEGEDPSTYQQLDDEMGGQLSKIIPPYPSIYETLRKEFGAQVGDYSGRGNTDAAREKAWLEFLKGETPMLYASYAGGGIGIDMHDADFPDLGIKGGDKPIVAVYLGPPYSGVLLEQAMGRPWRFGVKSDVRAVFLASDAEPDVRLMQTKIGPRMKALRAAVLGERDSLAGVMTSYTDEEKVRERQDSLAFAQGNEQKVSAKDFQVRSKGRTVGIDDWSHIDFPHSDTAKSTATQKRGMRIEVEGPGTDWATLFQDVNSLYGPPNPKNERGNETIDAIANEVVSGDGLPPGTPLQNLDPADKDVVVATAAAVAGNEVDINVDRDKEAVARQAMQAQLNMPGRKEAWVPTFPKGSKNVVWKYTGDPNDVAPKKVEGGPPLPRDIRTWYMGNIFSQEVGIKAIARRAKSAEAGDNIVRMNRSYQADRDLNFSQFSLMATDIMNSNHLDPNDPKVMNEIFDVVEGKWSTGDPNIAKAAGEISSLMGLINDELSAAGVKVKTPDGRLVPFSELTRDRQYMPHRIDWDAKVEDPLTGDHHTLREVMGRTFAEDKRARIIHALAEQSGATDNEVVDYLNRYKPGTPVLSHIHRARTINFPIIRKDWATLVGYFDQAAEGIAIEKNFGSDRSKLNVEINKINSTNGRKTINSMFDAMLEPQDWSGWESKFYRAMTGFEAASKMTLSAAKVPFHLVHAPLVLGGRVMPVAKAVGHAIAHPKEFMENATYTGTVARQLNVWDIAGGDWDKSLTHEVFKKTMFQALYKIGRAIAGESARVYMEQYAMNDLRKGGKATEDARRLVRDVMLIGDKSIDDAIASGRWSPDDLAKAQTAFANETMFSDNPLQMAGLARLEVKQDSPYAFWRRALRLTYALQSFSLKTTSLLREHLWDEVMVNKNYRPLAYFMLAYPVVGEMLRATGAGLRGGIQGAVSKVSGGPVRHDAWDKYLNELEDVKRHPAIGLLRRYIDDVTFAIAWDRTRRLSDIVLGLAEGEGKKVRSELRYMKDDEIEQDVGAAFNTLVVKPLDTLVTEGQIMTGQKSSPHEKHEKEGKTLLKFFLDEFPVTKEDPQLQDWLKTRKTTANKMRFF